MTVPPTRTVTLALLAAALVAFVLPTSANHLQTDSGKAIAFDHKTGNAYWVEVVITGADAARVTKVEAETGAPSSHSWVTLEKKSWGAYAASFGIGTNDVRFRATFSDGTQAVSCQFTHPQGVEQCTYAQPSGAWRSGVIGSTGRMGFGGETALVDIDDDGVQEVLAATEDGLFRYDRTATGFHDEMVVAPLYPGYGYDQLAVGDTDGDLVLEVYTAGHVYDGETGANRILWHHFDGESWTTRDVWSFGAVHDMVLGDIDGDGDDELYVLVDNGGSSFVYAIERTPTNFLFTQVATSDDYVARIDVGDADRDGDDELYMAYRVDDASHHLGLMRIDHTGAAYAQDTLVEGGFGNEVRGLVVGDGDGNGNDEIYALTQAWASDRPVLQRFSVREGGWAMIGTVLGPAAHFDLVLGDGDNDGLVELYTGTVEGHLVKVQFAAGAWSARAVHQLGSGEFLSDLSIGDADGDGKRELYGLSYNSNSNVCCPLTNVQRIALASGGTTSSTTTTTGGAFDATFTGVRGNEWWEQVSVSATGGTLSKVDVRLNGGAWQPMTKQSYGYTASIRAVQGTIVQFKATSTTGATDLSDCYRWIPAPNTDATKVPCSNTSTTTVVTDPCEAFGTCTFDATFSGVKGNAWWVQASVSANQALAGVDARVNCSGAWHPLAKQSYGYAASFNVPAGSKVDFRARATSGATDFSGGYIWPQATPTGGC